jgi:hypothetical protein
MEMQGQITDKLSTELLGDGADFRDSKPQYYRPNEIVQKAARTGDTGATFARRKVVAIRHHYA